jgi:hypothetical protein
MVNWGMPPGDVGAAQALDWPVGVDVALLTPGWVGPQPAMNPSDATKTPPISRGMKT